ncbi:asparagine synthase (glutamine-hydrolyzing) [Candidatus Peregrinibacteria bacterium]|nr:asparagine synthase (glutamine-hydrolyzing) [Candidatus Peregrinibacteria bacterium]
MCGIVGIHGKQKESWISDSNSRQLHRGPDDSGVFKDQSANLALAMRRLSILDIEGGHQPMSTPDGRYTIIFNGEIYNAQILRKKLEDRGAKFITDHSDTEVLLHLYAFDGEKMFSELNGMFAFVIYDRLQKTLFGARDHAGIKPFYYFHQDGIFAFASELKSLLALPFIKREMDFQGFFHYMSLMYVPGENTIIKSIKRLPAAHFFKYDLQTSVLKIKRWWTPKFSEEITKGHHWRDWAARIRSTFYDAAKRWTLADVSVGCSLSGGLDSSAIVGSLSKSGQKVKTYSLGFTGEGEKYWNELPRAAVVAKKWGTDHHELILDPEALLEDLISMVWHLDEPYGGGLPSWTVFKFMSKDVKVGLTGTGGDELFGNYGKWRLLEGNILYNFFVQQGSINKEDFKKKFFERHYYFSDDAKREFLSVQGGKMEDTAALLFQYFNAANSKSVRDRVCFTDLSTQLPEEFLMMTDRFSMAHSLEARTPFLDRELMELVFSMPADIRTRRFNLKYLLRESIKDLLPSEVVHARKKGFVIPIKLWLRGALRPLVQYMLNPQRLAKQKIFKPEFYTTFVEPHLEGKADNTNKIWSALMFQLWHHVFIDSSSLDKPTYNWKDIVS